MANEMECVIEEIKQERLRQINEEGWDAGHDDSHKQGEMAIAAACYADPRPKIRTAEKFLKSPINLPDKWPWSIAWWKPKGRRRDLIRAAALIVAEIERLDRDAMNQEPDAALARTTEGVE